MSVVVVTGSAGLIGAESVRDFAEEGSHASGIGTHADEAIPGATADVSSGASNRSAAH